MSMDLFEELLTPITVSELLGLIFSNTFDEGLGGNWKILRSFSEQQHVI